MTLILRWGFWAPERWRNLGLGTRFSPGVIDLGSWTLCSTEIYKRAEETFTQGFPGSWVEPEWWLRWSAHPIGIAVGRDWAWYLLLLPAPQKWQLSFGLVVSNYSYSLVNFFYSPLNFHCIYNYELNCFLISLAFLFLIFWSYHHFVCSFKLSC